MALRAIASVNLAAVERNVVRLRRHAAPAGLCAVVKADGYGHGAVQVARAALSAGASWLAVATAGEGAELRAAGIGAPLLVMGALSDEELPVAVRAGADVVAWSERFVDAAAALAREGEAVRIHVKLDTGMGRLGTRNSEQALAVARHVRRSVPATVLVGAMTHFATADEDPEFMAAQLAVFGDFAAELRVLQPELVLHAANSAATLRDGAAHLSMVRCGIAIYGCDPMNRDPFAHDLEPALELTSYLAAVKPALPGQSAGYGRTFVAQQPTWLGTAPIGYADGIRRALSNNCDVLIGGRRCPLVGNISMDNITVDLGPEPEVVVGQPVTIIGGERNERITAEELAGRIDTINYEIVCGISGRVPRRYHRDGEPA